MKAQRQAYRGRHWIVILLVGGCAVYHPDLLDDRGDTSFGGTAVGAAGDAAAAGRGNDTAGSSSTANNGGGGSGGARNGGAAGSGGEVSPAGGAGADTSAGAAGGPDGGAMACVSETVAQFCTRVGKDCGTVAGTDNCGNAVVGANCGSCKDFKMCGGGGQDNVCGALTDPSAGGVVTASSVGSVGEDGGKAFDANVNTKWFAGDGITTGWLAFQFPGTASHVVHAYSVTSANDVPGRDPSDWQLQGSSNGATWVLVDQQSAQVFANRHQTTSYTCANSTAYRWYRLLITANSGATALQLAELALYAN